MPLYVKFILGYLVVGAGLDFYMSVHRRVDKPSPVDDVGMLSSISSVTHILFITCWPIWWPLWLRERKKHRKEDKEPIQPPETTRGK
jgi:hypothetical protein